MTKTCMTADIEAGLGELLEAEGVSASAPPVPANLGDNLPHVHVTRTGGNRAIMVQDMHMVTLDVYADTEAAAMARADGLTAWAVMLAGQTIGGAYCHDARLNSIPYNNPDPRHPNIARASFGVQLRTRVLHA